MIKVYYFSGTGNTFWSARFIAQGLGASLYPIDSLAKDESSLVSADAVVFLAPAYAYGLPRMVRRVIEKAALQTDYAAGLVTFGSSPGGALAEFAALFRRKGVSRFYVRGIGAVENYIPIFGAPRAHHISRRLARHKTETKAALEAILERTKNDICGFYPFSRFIRALFDKGLPHFSSAYNVRKECNGCGICAKLCPADAIRIENARPVFSSLCEHCQACMNWCPRKSITYLRLRAGTRRYQHPEVSLEDMLRTP